MVVVVAVVVEINSDKSVSRDGFSKMTIPMFLVKRLPNLATCFGHRVAKGNNPHANLGYMRVSFCFNCFEIHFIRSSYCDKDDYEI